MDKAKSTAFMLKLVGDVATTLSVALVDVGLRAGLFRAMAGAGALSTEQIAAKSGVHLRYLEEWLAAMLCAGYVEHDAAAGTWTLPDEHAMFLSNPASEYFLGGLIAGAPPVATVAPLLAEAFKTGEGIRFQDYGEGTPLALEGMNRAVYEARLVKAWLPAMPQVVAALEGGGSAIDVGCGTGVVSMLIAQAFPKARVAGLDFDARSIELARENARHAGVAERIEFQHRTAADLQGPAGESSGWDFISIFDCIHDLPDPLGALRRVRTALAPGGTALMVEPKVAERIGDDVANPFARMLHGMSCLHCVPQSLAQGGPGLGACWGEGRARVMAHEAGFSHFQALPIRSPVQAFYEMRA